MRLWLVFFGGALALVGCTQDFGVFEADSSVPPDRSSSDGDASTDSGNDAAPEAGGDGGGLMFQCGAGSVSDCSACAGMTEPCVFCSTTSTNVFAGVCQQPGMSCFGAGPTGFTLCMCAGGNPSSCPRPYQVCRNGTCRTCEESINDVNFACMGGGKCNPADGGCS